MTPLNVTENLLSSVLWWNVYDDAHVIATIDDTRKYVLPDTVLQPYHPVLPAALRAHLMWLEQTKPFDQCVYLRQLENTLSVLRWGIITLSDIYEHSRRLSMVSAMDKSPESSTLFEIRGEEVEIEYAPGYGKNIPFVVDFTVADFTVASDELERRYPGSIRRNQFGSDLGMTGEELFRHVFTTPSVTNEYVNLKGVAFE